MWSGSCRSTAWAISICWEYSLSPPYNILIYANALTGYVECMRDIVLQGRVPNPLVYGWMLATSVSTFYFGYWFFDRYRNVIVDVI